METSPCSLLKHHPAKIGAHGEFGIQIAENGMNNFQMSRGITFLFDRKVIGEGN